MVKNVNLTHVILSDPDNNYEPYDTTTPLPISGTVTVSGGGVGGGDATAANQTTMISHLSDIDSAVTGTLSVADSTARGSLATIAGAVDGSEMQVDIVSSVLPSGAATSALQTSGNADLSTLAGCVDSAGSRIDVNLSTDSVGLATSALQTTGNSSLSSIDGKMSQGSDVTLSNAQQVLCYGRDTGGVLDALRTDSAGHLEVVVDDFVKGQAIMANSLPVVIASDQSTLNINNAEVTNVGSHANAANNVTINFGADSSTIAVENINIGSIYYEDSATSSFDGLDILGSIDNTNFYNIGQLYPSVEGAVRTASYTGLDLRGLKYLKLQNSSTTDNYTNVYATVCGSP